MRHEVAHGDDARELHLDPPGPHPHGLSQGRGALRPVALPRALVIPRQRLEHIGRPAQLGALSLSGGGPLRGAVEGTGGRELQVARGAVEGGHAEGWPAERLRRKGWRRRCRRRRCRRRRRRHWHCGVPWTLARRGNGQGIAPDQEAQRSERAPLGGGGNVRDTQRGEHGGDGAALRREERAVGLARVVFGHAHLFGQVTNGGERGQLSARAGRQRQLADLLVNGHPRCLGVFRRLLLARARDAQRS